MLKKEIHTPELSLSPETFDGFSKWMRKYETRCLSQLFADEDVYTPADSTFYCLHLWFDTTVEACKVKFADEEGNPVWYGDLLCADCFDKDPEELAKEGLLFSLSRDELLEIMMEGSDT